MEQDIAVTCEALLVHGKYRGGHSQPAIELNTGSPMEEIEKGPKELKGFPVPIKNNTMRKCSTSLVNREM